MTATTQLLCCTLRFLIVQRRGKIYNKTHWWQDSFLNVTGAFGLWPHILLSNSKERQLRRESAESKWLNVCSFGLRSLTYLHPLHYNSSRKPAWQEKRKSERKPKKRKDGAELATSNRQFGWPESSCLGLLGVIEAEWKDINNLDKKGTSRSAHSNACGQMLKIESSQSQNTSVF